MCVLRWFKSVFASYPRYLQVFMSVVNKLMISFAEKAIYLSLRKVNCKYLKVMFIAKLQSVCVYIYEYEYELSVRL